MTDFSAYQFRIMGAFALVFAVVVLYLAGQGNVQPYAGGCSDPNDAAIEVVCR